MPTPFEEELLAMARAQSREAAQAEAPTPATLPDLNPEMLMSASAQKEFQAARGFFPQRSPVMATDLSDIAQEQRQRPPRELAPRPTRQAAAPADFDFDMGDSMELTDADLAPPVHGRSVQASSEDALLSSLFMNREAQEALGSGGYAAGDDGFNIGFDSDIDIPEGRGTPIASARWQVGREDPPAMPFYREPTPRLGPSDGTVVSSRGPNGSWQTTPRAQAPRPASARAVGTPHVQRNIPNRLDFISQAASAPPDPPPRPAPAPAPAPRYASVSRYDHILGDD